MSLSPPCFITGAVIYCSRLRSCLCKWKSFLSYSRKELGWEICLQGRVYRKDSTLLINNRLSLQPLWHATVCICYGQAFPFSFQFFTQILGQLLKLGSVSSLVSRDILFMLVSWWYNSEKIWAVFLKHIYQCREKLSLLRRGVLRESWWTISQILLCDRRGRCWTE